jgi:hypothetical protein
MQSVTSVSSTKVFAILYGPCSKQSQLCARLRSVPQAATKSQPARLHKSNFKNDHRRRAKRLASSFIRRYEDTTQGYLPQFTVLNRNLRNPQFFHNQMRIKLLS